jgi:hypothetical protein
MSELARFEDLPQPSLRGVLRTGPYRRTRSSAHSSGPTDQTPT